MDSTTTDDKPKTAESIDSKPIILNEVVPKVETETQDKEKIQSVSTTASDDKSSPIAQNLNVMDALTYLDQTKKGLENKPYLYHRFLEIMKEFKNNKDLDTLSVIQRVTSLFRSYPNLIMGFNPFLPEGYHINLSGDSVHVDTPSGPVNYNLPEASETDGSPIDGSGTVSTGVDSAIVEPVATSPLNRAPVENPSIVEPTEPTDLEAKFKRQESNLSNYSVTMKSASNIISSMSEDTKTSKQEEPQSEDKKQPSLLSQEVTNTIEDNGDLGDDPDKQAGKAPVEFNQAIKYVNKVKTRYSKDPSVYRVFLEILQVYQRDQKSIQQVYAQVRELFADAPDLLDEFQQFLPDNSSSPAVNGFANHESYPPPEDIGNTISKKSNKRGRGPSNLPPPPSIQEQQGYNPPHIPVDKRPYPQDVRYNPEVSMGLQGPMPPLKQIKRTQPSEELLFFEKCKRVMGSKQVYNEFLKILNLFSQEIIEAKVLIERVEPFLSKNADLFDWFKKFVKFEEEETVFNIPAVRTKLDLRNEKQHGRSYRRIPDEVPRLVCSGRDDLCKEVLNDDWLSVPIYVSESGFVSHKKTQFEEALHQCEEQRYEFDMNINNNLHTIALLEPIAKKIQKMTAEEKSNYKLENGLGGFSKCIYKKVIKLVYDKEKGLEVIDAIHNNPAVAVPVVLNRLKQKDQEWRRLQREWNKVWRDVDNKNFYRALDHQAALFKSADKKAILPKSLTCEIENIVKEQQEQFLIQQQQHEKEAERLTELYRSRITVDNGKQLNTRKEFLKAIETESKPATADQSLGSLMPGSVKSRINNNSTCIDEDTCKVLAIGNSPQTERYQFEFLFRDKSIFEDIRQLINKINNNGASDEELEQDSTGKAVLDESFKQKEITKGFIGILFNLVSENGFAKDDLNSVDQTNKTEGNFNKENLRYALGKTSVSNYETNVDGNSDTQSSIKSNRYTAKSINGDYFPTASGLKFPLPKRNSHVAYGSSNLYYFIRLYQMLYIRLSKLKNLSKELLADPPRWTRKSKLAQKLGLQSKALDEYLNTDRYEVLLKLIEELCQGSIDGSNFEDICRRMFGTGGYIIFTVDRLLNGLVKQINNLTSDAKNLEFIERFFLERAADVPNEAEYRLFAEKSLVDDKIYRFEYFYDEEVLTVKLLTKDEYLTEQLLTPNQEWSLYVDSFIQTRQTRPSLLGAPGSTRLAEITKTKNFLKGNFNLASLYGDKLTQENVIKSAKEGIQAEGPDSEFIRAQTLLHSSRRPFLQRNLPKEIPVETSRDVITNSALQIKICSNTYKMFFLSGTEDYFFRINHQKNKK